MSELSPAIAVPDAQLQTMLQSAMAERFGHAQQIIGLARRPWEYYTSSTMEALDVTLADGSHLSLIAKDVGTGGKLQEAAAVKPAFLFDPLREAEIYRRVLSSGETGAPAFFGTATDHSQSRCLLFLENVPGIPLWQVGDVEIWCDVARWLAHFHSSNEHSNDADTVLSARLIHYDRAFYANWSERAKKFAQETPAMPAKRVAEIARLTEQYDRRIDQLLHLPITLIHGEFVASNVLVQKRAAGHRICAVDWEMAALGPALMDLADLTAGKWSDQQKRSITNAYREAMPDMCRMSVEQFEQHLTLCRLHRAMQWLGWAANWTPPTEHSQDWLAEASRCETYLARNR